MSPFAPSPVDLGQLFLLYVCLRCPQRRPFAVSQCSDQTHQRVSAEPPAARSLSAIKDRARSLAPRVLGTPVLFSYRFRSTNSQPVESYFFFPEIMIHVAPSRARHEGRFAIVTNVGRGMRWARRVAAGLGLADERSGAHGQAVWSWHPGADAKSVTTMLRMTGARTPVPGESSEQPSKPSRREGRACSARPVVTAACFFSAGGPRARPAPGLPCALILEEGE